MYGLRKATRQLDPDTHHTPGVCRADARGVPRVGWFVPIVETESGREALIRLLVQERRSPFPCSIPFLIDTGSPVSVIPRSLVSSSRPRDPFPRSRTRGRETIAGLTGGEVTGFRFDVLLHIIPSGGGTDPAHRFTFADQFSLLVIEPPAPIDEEGETPRALLGMDALQELIMVADRDHVVLWRPD